MTQYEVYATRWDDPRKVEELLPARGLQFSLPLSDHGTASFAATVEPGRSLWRQAVGLPLSGLLIARDGQPVWSGWITDEQQTADRSFAFTAKEWGSFFTQTLATPRVYAADTWTDAGIFRDLVTAAQAQPGQNVKVTVPAGTLPGTPTGLEIKAWENATTEAKFRTLADADGGPEWYFGTGGTLANPTRPLVLGRRLGAVDPVAELQYVAQTVDWKPTAAAPGLVLLSDLFPAGPGTAAVEDLPRRGGNVIAVSRTRNLSRSATRVVAVGDGQDAAQLQRETPPSPLLGRGWPRLTAVTSHADVGDPDALSRLARADLAAMSGIATRYGLTSLDGDPDWTQVPRGSTMQVKLDTDVYAGPRPYTFTSRLLNTTVAVDDTTGRTQVTWELAETMEAS